MPRSTYKRRYKKKTYTKNRSLAARANAKANYALSQLNTEVKYKQFAFSPASSGIGSITVLNNLAQGTSSNNQRIGQSVRFRSIDLRMQVQQLADENLTVRYMLVRDSSPNGVLPNTYDIIDSAFLDEVRTFRNLDYTKRFTILWDTQFAFTALSRSNDNIKLINHYVDLEANAKSNSKGKQVNETNYGLGISGTISDISENAYYLLAIGNSMTGALTTDVNVRLRYIDN